MSNGIPKITPFLWFDNQAEEAARFRMLQDKDAGKSQRVMKAMMEMKKIDIARLEAAYHQQ